jgi:hypothetical protein
MPLQPTLPRLRLHKFTPDLILKIHHRALYDRVKQDFGQIQSVLKVLGCCKRHKLRMLDVLVTLVPTGMRMTAVETDDDGADYQSRIKEACRSPNSLFEELRDFYTLECDFAMDAVGQPMRLATLKRTISR